jgi:hypothetical protein
MTSPRMTSSRRARPIHLLALALLAACGGSEPMPTEAIPEFASTHAASGYICGLTADGAVWCWGSSASARFGVGEGGSQLVYTQAPAAGGVRFAALSLGSEHASGTGVRCRRRSLSGA